MTEETYPKMLYRSEGMFATEEELKAGFAPGGSVRSMTVLDAEAETVALDDGWTQSLSEFIGADKPKRGRKPKADTAEGEPA